MLLLSSKSGNRFRDALCDTASDGFGRESCHSRAPFERAGIRPERRFRTRAANPKFRPFAALQDRAYEWAQSAHSGHSQTVRRTGQVDPELP
jgi:hypothetical protein